MNITNSIVMAGLIESFVSAGRAGTPWWILVLALYGIFALFMTAMKNGINLVYLVAYLVGAIKWAIDSIRKKWKKHEVMD